MSQNPFDVPGSVINIEMMNPNLSFKSLKSGDRFLLTVEIKKDVWELLQECRCRAGMVLDADVCVAAVNEPDGGTKEAPKPRSLSPANILHSTFLPTQAFWMFVAELTGETIENEKDCKAALKRYLDVGSLSELTTERMTTLMETYHGFCVRHGITSEDG